MDRKSLSSLSSISAARPRRADDFDRSAYSVGLGQALVATCNDPRAEKGSGRWPWARQDNSWQLPPPPIDQSRYPNITRADLQGYLSVVSGSFETFLHDRDTLEAGLHQQLLLTEGARLTQGDGLAQALQQVPSKFFQEDFALERPEIFSSICEVKEDWEVQERIDEMTGYLDVVETQLMREIGGRSKSVFEAAGVLQDLHRTLCSTSTHIKGLRELVCDMDEHTYTSALCVSRLQRRRRNLLATLEEMKAIEEVVASKAALACLLEGQDYAGALELLENLRHMVDGQMSVGLQAFRHTPPQVEETIEQVQQLMEMEFLSLTHFTDMHTAIERAIAEVTAHPERAIPGVAHQGRGTDAGHAAGTGGVGWPDQDGADEGMECTASSSNSMQQTEMAAAREQLHDRLLPPVVGLHRSNKLIGIGVLSQLRDNAAAEVKAAIREAVERVLPQLLTALGDSAPEAEGLQLAEKLQLLHHGGFMQLLGAVLRVVDACTNHVVLLSSLLTDILSGLKAQPAQIAQLRREMTVTVQSLTDVAHGRWIKLLTARTAVHSRLKLYEFRELIDASEAVCAHAERHGAKPPAALRTAVAGQCRAYLEHMHTRCITQLQNLLEAEQWVAVEVPDGFQRIVERLSVGCASLADGTATTYAPRNSLQHSASIGARMDSNGSSAGAESNGRQGETDTSLQAGVSGQQQRPTHVLQLQGRQYHMVNSSLILIKLLDDYLALHDVVPLFGADIATRTIELVKGFNTQVCHLVLGAGAMKSAGLRSISAKHLALSSQSLNVLLALLPLLCGALAALVAQPRRSLLLPEFDRLLQDLQTHLAEIHTKLVDIMHDRLTATAQQLAKESEAWAAGPPKGGAAATAAAVATGRKVAPPFPPSESIRTLTRQLSTLRSVLLPILQREEVYAVFGRVASLYSEVLAGALDALQPRGEMWEAQRRSNTLHLLQCFQELPMDPARAPSYMSRLSTFYSKHYGILPEFTSNGDGVYT